MQCIIVQWRDKHVPIHASVLGELFNYWKIILLAQ